MDGKENENMINIVIFPIKEHLKHVLKTNVKSIWVPIYL